MLLKLPVTRRSLMQAECLHGFGEEEVVETGIKKNNVRRCPIWPENGSIKDAQYDENVSLNFDDEKNAREKQKMGCMEYHWRNGVGTEDE